MRDVVQYAGDSLATAAASTLDPILALFLPDLVFRSGWHEQSDDEPDSSKAGHHEEKVQVVLLIPRDQGIIGKAKTDVENDVPKSNGANHWSSILGTKHLSTFCYGRVYQMMLVLS